MTNKEENRSKEIESNNPDTLKSNSNQEKDNPSKKSTRRPKRVPLGGMQSKLHVEQSALDEGNYAYRWFNDEGGRLKQAKDAYWEPVEADSGGNDRRVVGRNSDGSPKYAQLMRIEKKYHLEDQNRKFEAINETEKEIKRGRKTEGSYTPSQGIKIERG